MPAPQKKGQFAQQVEQTLGIFPGTKAWSPFPLGPLNLQDSPPAIDDKEFSYLENMLRVGNGYMRACPDVASPLYTATGKKIVYFFWYNIGLIDYVAIFFDDGTAVQVQQSNAVETVISATAGTFYVTGGGLPVASQSGSQYLLIANNNTSNDYWIWDGSILYGAGTSSPTVELLSGGENYSSVPTATAFGGTGSGMVLTPIVDGGSVVDLIINNPGTGYGVGDIVQVAFSGGGSDDSAVLEAMLSSGSVAALSITASGSGYGSAPTVSFTGGGGAGATATASISGGVASLSVSAGGSGYTSVPTVTITGGGGSGATATAVLTTGAVSSFIVTNPGSGYTSTPTAAITGGGGTGATALVVISQGVTGLVITNGGSGYTSAPTVVFSGMAGAAAVAHITSSGIASVTVVNGGTGFTSAPLLSFVGGGGAGATGIAVLAGTSVAAINVLAGGTGYFNAPTVTVSAPASGTAATAIATVDNGVITGITITDAGTGYTGTPEVVITPNVSDTLAAGASISVVLAATSIASVTVSSTGSGYTTAPAVEVEPGANHAAAAIIELMPFGVSGNSIETFNSRVWLFYPHRGVATQPTGGDFSVSAPGSLTDFATSDGGVLFTNTDRFLRKQYTGARQSNGYLYAFGDCSISVISNIQTSGVPATTTFTYSNTDPQVGMAWRDSCQDFGRTIIFANKLGVYGLYGGAATKVSAKLDRLFNNAIYPPDSRALTPSSAVSTIFNVKWYSLLFTAQDPETGAVRNVMATWNETQGWSLLSQTPAITYIGTQEVDSENTAWATDGTSLYQMFAQPSVLLEKRWSTKMYGTDALFILKDFFALYLQGQDFSGTGINATVSMVASGVATQPASSNMNLQSVANTQFNSANYPEMLFSPPSFAAASPYWPVWGTGTGGFSFDTLMVRFSSRTSDFAISNLVIAYTDNTALM